MVQVNFIVHWWYIPLILAGWYVNAFVSAFVREATRDLRETKRFKRITQTRRQPKAET
jgi:hypothetical protein